MLDHAPTQDGSGQSAQGQQQQLPAQSPPQKWHDARPGLMIGTHHVALGQQLSAGYHQPGHIPPCKSNPYTHPPKQKATDQAEHPGRDPLNPEPLCWVPQYPPRPEMATELPQEPCFPMPSAPIKLLAPNNLDTDPDAWRSRLQDGQPAPDAPPSKATAPPTRDLSGFSYKPQNPTNKNFLRDRGDLVQPLNDADAATKSNYDPKTIARDILIASGRHPTEPCLNHHLTRLRDVFNLVDTSSDLDTFRWDIVDAPRMQVHWAKPVKKPRSPGTLFTPNKDPDSKQLQRSQPVQQPRTTNQNPPVVVPRDSRPQDTPPSRPAVRISLLEPAVNTSKPKPLLKVQLLSTPNLSRLQQSSQNQPPASQSQSRQSQVKPSGGPRKELSGEMVGTKSAPRIEVAIPQSAPVPYPVYACEWKNCVSELHNLELLRKHVLKCHIPYTLTCGWLGCTSSDMMAAAELFEHVKAHHIGPLAWKLGDGPSAHRSVDNGEACRSLQAQATPESNQPGGEDALIFPASYSSIRAFNRVHGNKSQLDKAHEIFKAVKRLKERIGIGLDPGGCQLATPERNERASDEEEVYELHPESETESAGTSELRI